jgi:hypothetical protein
MNAENDHTAQANSVIVVSQSDVWIVLVSEDGEQHSRMFAREDYAKNYASGQRMRLNLSQEEGDECQKER